MEDLPPPIRPPAGPTLPLISLWQKLFFGPSGMRAGWRLLIFFAVVVGLMSIEGAILRALRHRPSMRNGLSPVSLLISEGSFFAIFLVASWIMAKIEGRSLADYGLPFGSAFRLQFWRGIAIGFASISVLIGSLWAAGVFLFGAFALHGADAWRYGVLWGAVFLFVALFEEFSFRGYVLFTLSTGVGFWPAATVLSYSATFITGIRVKHG